MKTLVCRSQSWIATPPSCPSPGFVSWHGMLWTAGRHSPSTQRPIHHDTNSQCPVPTTGLDELQPPCWTLMLDTCSARFQQASLVCKQTCSHKKATCPRPGSAFAHGRKELRAVCGSTKPCRGQAKGPSSLCWASCRCLTLLATSYSETKSQPASRPDHKRTLHTVLLALQTSVAGSNHKICGSPFTSFLVLSHHAPPLPGSGHSLPC